MIKYTGGEINRKYRHIGKIYHEHNKNKNLIFVLPDKDLRTAEELL